MIQFLTTKTPLQNVINDACNILYSKINTLNIEEVEMDPFFKEYFVKCHFKRQIFSLKTSARLLHDSIVACQKDYKSIVIMDYGAGLGTLYILAKMIGMKQVIYNDLMPEFGAASKAVDSALGLMMDEYIVGNTLQTCLELQTKNISCDIIISRNVVEHIYSLEDYFQLLHQYQPNAILYNSTTANWRNPATHLQHVYLHLKHQQKMIDTKYNFIKETIPELPDPQAFKLAKIMLTYGAEEFHTTLNQFKKDNKYPIAKHEYTNYCEINGNWAEHLIPYSEYKKAGPQYTIVMKPGFWDEDYSNPIKSLIGKSLNFVTSLLGKHGVLSSSFIYIIATPKQ